MRYDLKLASRATNWSDVRLASFADEAQAVAAFDAEIAARRGDEVLTLEAIKVIGVCRVTTLRNEAGRA